MADSGQLGGASNPTKVAHLQADFPNVELYEADLMKPGSFDKCFEGCDYVFHTASPFQLSVEDPQRDLVDPAVNGTLNVLRAARRAGVKRVVLTSSVAAVVGQATPPADKIHTEDDWNTDSTLENGAYRLSKSLAERTAWNFVEGKLESDPGTGPELRVINPAFVAGPPQSSRSDSESVRLVTRALSGAIKEAGGCAPSCFGVVDVRDVALAHLRALEIDEAQGRFILSSEDGVSQLEICQHLANSGEFNNDLLPTTEKAPIAFRPHMSNAKARTVLGIEFTPVSKALVDMGHALEHFGLVKLKE